MQQELEKILPGMAVTVFGRYRDFIAKIKIEPPDAVCTKPLLIKQIGGFSPALAGVAKGKTVDEFTILSVDQAVDPKAIDQTTVVGILDFLGRTGMMNFVKEFFPTAPKLKRVTKVEDLLPLLTFNMAKGIVIETKYVDYFKKKSQLNFVTTALPKSSSGIISLALKDGSTNDALVKKLKAAKCDFFGVDQWK